MMKYLPWFCVAMLVLAFSALPAAAHKTGLARVDVTVAGDKADISVLTPALDVAIAIGRKIIPGETVSDNEPMPDDLAARIEAYFDQRLRLAMSGKEPCTAQSFSVAPHGEQLRIERRYRCPADISALALDYDLFFHEDADHRALVMAVGPSGPQMEAVVDRASRVVQFTFEKGAPSAAGPSFLSLLVLGVEHIIEGVDHVIFLLVLLLGLPTFRQAMAVVTAFTLAHSITLGLAWFGLVTLPSWLVEIAIALSIAYVAAENLFRRDMRRRWLLAGGFGLIHGLGFYGALADLGLEGADAVTVLFGFNLGVELGQAIILACVAPFLWWVRRQEWRWVAVRYASIAFIAVALWFVVERSLA